MPDLTRAIEALTYDLIERSDGKPVPLLHRSIANDLVMFAKQPELFSPRLLLAVAAAIDEALLALVEE